MRDDFIFDLPHNELTVKWKIRLLRKRGVIIEGDNLKLKKGLSIIGNVCLGKAVSMNRNVMIAASHNIPVTIGNYCLIGPNVVIRNENHGFEDTDNPMKFQSKKALPIIIEDDVWIASNCVILAGAKIGKGTIVAAGAVVTEGEIPPYSILGGVPAKIIGSRIVER